ncbi:MAG: hypothetical protein QXG39_08560 [Candidatus Aenigmatarchaeota archaeon]
MPEVRVNEKEIKFKVGYHEWAWSIRTSGMPITAIIECSDGYKEIDIGRTCKKPTTYFMPTTAVVVVRYYWSYRGYMTVYFYSASSGAEIAIADEKNNYEPEYRDKITAEERKAIEWWLAKNKD